MTGAELLQHVDGGGDLHPEQALRLKRWLRRRRERSTRDAVSSIARKLVEGGLKPGAAREQAQALLRRAKEAGA